MGSKKSFIKHHKVRGEWVEARFLACAAERGFNVTKPWGESSRYDFVLDHNGQFLRVQVKSTMCPRGEAYMCSLHNSAKRCYYRGKDIDFFAVYLVPEDIWYIIPVRVCARLLLLWPRCTGRKHKYDCYREAWDLLRVRKPKTRAAASSET